MLLKNQDDISLQRGMPVEIVADSQSVSSISAETVQFYYYNSGVLTVDAGQAAGVNVVAKLKQAGVLDSIGGKIGSFKNTSFSFGTGSILTEEVLFPFTKAENADDGTGEGQLDSIVSSFSNGQYCIDYRNGIIYGKKATTGVSDTASYKIAVSTSGGSSSAPSETIIVDANGNQITSFGSPSTEAKYKSPTDFSVAYTSASTLTLTGLSISVVSPQVKFIKVTDTTANTTVIYNDGVGGYSFKYSSGVITAYKDGVVASIFAVTNSYIVGLDGQEKAYNLDSNTLNVIELSKDRDYFPISTLVNAANIAAGTAYYPSSTGVLFDGARDLSISGILTDADGTVTITLEGTNNPDPSTANWSQLYFYDATTGADVNTLTVTNGSLKIGLSVEKYCFKYYRIKLVTSGATNTVTLFARHSA